LVLWPKDTGRIRGELLKLGIKVGKSTIRKYMKEVRGPVDSSKQHCPVPLVLRAQGRRAVSIGTWGTFLRNHAKDIWACDFLQTYDLFFRTIFVFVMIELGSRRLVHFGVARNPTDGWAAQQLREATPFGDGPRFLITIATGKHRAANLSLALLERNPKVSFLRGVVLHNVSGSQLPVDGRATQFQHLLSIDRMDGLCHTSAVCFHFWAATIHRVTPTGLLLSE